MQPLDDYNAGREVIEMEPRAAEGTSIGASGSILAALVLCLAAGVAPAGEAPAARAPLHSPHAWEKIDEGKTGEREGAMLLWAPDPGRMLLAGGTVQGAAYVQSFDPAARAWSDLSRAAPAKDGIHSYYQTAYDPETKTLYCLAGGPVLHAFDAAAGTWKAFPPAPELDGLSWHALACDPAGRRLVAIGADKEVAGLGWTRTVVLDIPSCKWTRLDSAGAEALQERRELVAAREAAIDLGGRIRLAWYRDPKGVGTDEELRALGERCAALAKMARMGAFAADAGAVASHLAARRTLEALRAARALERKLDEEAEARYPVPTSRRNSPLVFDARHRVFVLFGGDHEDYLLNDTWVLDLEKKSWRRCRPPLAPSPRAGHALAWLPRSGRVALYEGYVQSPSTDYGAIAYKPIDPAQLWLYDVAADRWELAGSWPISKKPAEWPAPVGHFYGYRSDFFSPPALAADPADRLVLAASRTAGIWYWPAPRPCETWILQVDPARTDPDGRDRLGAPPGERLRRPAPFLAEFCEVPDAPKDTGLDALPENRWTKLPAPPRNPCHGCRGRDWGTAVWDSDRDQVLLWGGGHCVRSASTVAHWSPASGRIVEGFDADEPYGGNGSGGFDSSIWNRPWVCVHSYNHYAYDPKCRLLVAGRGYLYDPDRMDWLRMEQMRLPYAFDWGHNCVETSPHGAVAWAPKAKGEEAGLWLFDREKGWIDLEPRGKLFVPYCDSHGMVHDSRRDRMLFSGVAGGYMKRSNGSFLAFDFRTRAVEAVTPANPELNRTQRGRELAYVEHADWVLIGDHVRVGDPEKGKPFTRVYDCGANRMFLLDAGPAPDGYSVGWMYDAKRKLAYAFTTNGEAWAIRIVPETAARLEKAEE